VFDFLFLDCDLALKFCTKAAWRESRPSARHSTVCDDSIYCILALLFDYFLYIMYMYSWILALCFGSASCGFGLF